MKLDLTQPIRTLNKKPIVELKSKQDKEGVPMVLKGIVIDSLLGQCTGDNEPAGSKFRHQRFTVSVKVQQAANLDEVELELEDVNVIKKAIETRQPGLLPLFHGQALALIEGKPTGLEPE
jgi:hypothetical protein